MKESSAWNPKWKLGFSWQDSGREFRIPIAGLREEGAFHFKEIIPGQGRIAATEGDGGALLIPYDSGMLCRTAGKSTAEYLLPVFNEPDWKPYWGNMPLYGAFADGTAVAAVVEGGKFDFHLRLRTAWGDGKRYTLDPVFAIRDIPEDAPPAEDIVIIRVALSGDWREIAAWYCQYNLKERGIKTLAERTRNNPELEYSTRALTVRCRMCVKPLPSVIMEQTPANEPEPKVFMTFDEVGVILDEFARQQVGPAEFCLVGWNHGGHDGAFPQLFPVEESLGGEEKLVALCRKAAANGYPLSVHDNYYDGYTLAWNFNLDDACHTPGEHGGPMTGGGKLAGGQAYRICPRQALEKYAAHNMPEVAARLPLKGAYFVDVISIIPMKKCYHPGHPLSRSGNAASYKKILAMQQRLFRVAMSEGARDWALPELDRAYMICNCIENSLPFCDEHVPLFQMVYHGILIYNNCRDFVNTWPGEEAYLRNLAWGGMPLIYFHHLFNPRWGQGGDGWHRDLVLNDPDQLRKDVARIRRITDDIAKLSPLATRFITGYTEHTPTLLETEYDNGGRVLVNLADTDCEWQGTIIPARDFLVCSKHATIQPRENKTFHCAM